MAMKVLSAFCILALMSTLNMVMAVQKCSCSDTTWDCSFREKSIILPEENCFKENWLFQHNKLLTIPTIRYVDVVDVSHNMLGLNETASIYFYAVRYLDLSSNYLTSLKILRWSDIETLVATDNAILKIERLEIQYVFKELILARNKITTIPPSSFPTSLTYLDLSENPLTTISQEAFKGMYKLQILHLNDTQQLYKLENGTFDDLTSLKLLSLNGNKLTQLADNMFTTLENLEALFLQMNNLSKIPLGIFSNLYSLRLLNLDNNRLTELPEELFSRLHSLEDLSVRSNLLKTLPDLRLCSGPISTVAFTDNLIERLDEAAVRALLRNGFLYGEIIHNPVDRVSLSWIDDTKDIVLRPSSDDCRTIEVLKLSNHGYISFCAQGYLTTTTEYY